MKRIIHTYPFYFILLISILLFSCNGSKSFTKKAKKLEEAGLVQEAAENYYTALRKKRTNTDAIIGMKSTGQLVLNQKLSEFAREKNFGDNKKAVYAFIEVEKYHKKISDVGVQLEIPDYYVSDFKTVKEAYLHELYEEGNTLLEDEKFKEAEELFNEISRLDPNFKDAGNLMDIAYCEPLYNAGVEAMNLNHFRSAYENFEKVVARLPEFKDAGDLKSKMVEAGRFTIAVLKFENGTNQSGLESKITAFAANALVEINDPFLKVVDRQNFETILEEQKLQLTGVIDEETAVNVGELLGAKAIITGTVLSYEESKGKLQSYTKDGYEQYKMKKLNEEDGKYYYVDRYRKTQYNEFSQSNTVTVSFQYRVVSLETGEVMLSRIIQKEEKDDVYYASFNGEQNMLYPSVNGKISMNRNDKNALDNMLKTTDRSPKSTATLSNDALMKVSKQMSDELEALLRIAIK